MVPRNTCSTKKSNAYQRWDEKWFAFTFQSSVWYRHDNVCSVSNRLSITLLPSYISSPRIQKINRSLLKIMEVINHPIYFDVGIIHPLFVGCSTLVLMTAPRDTAGNKATTRPHIFIVCSLLFVPPSSEIKYLLNVISCKLYLLNHHRLDSTWHYNSMLRIRSVAFRT